MPNNKHDTNMPAQALCSGTWMATGEDPAGHYKKQNKIKQKTKKQKNGIRAQHWVSTNPPATYLFRHTKKDRITDGQFLGASGEEFAPEFVAGNDLQKCVCFSETDCSSLNHKVSSD